MILSLTYGIFAPFCAHKTVVRLLQTIASVFAGAITKGFPIRRALEIAVNFTVECIKATLPEADLHKYGVKFEECIPSLIEKIK